MKLPSAEYIFKKSSYTFKRFPLALISAALVAIPGIYLAEISPEEMGALFNVIRVAILGIPLFIVLPLIAEKREWSFNYSITVHGLALGVLLLYYFLLPDNINQAPNAHWYRYALYFLVAHLFVAIGPFWGKDEALGFWQYNKTLFLRILTAALFSGVLFIGLTIALLSIDALLGVTIDDETYFQLFIFIASVFNTWFFLAGIPRSIDRLNAATDYPKGLKIFSQNILIPLVVIYLIILYLYAGKIILQWSWPEGWVANLILSFSIVGILAILLLYPIQEKIENRWIKRFSKSYFWSLGPLVLLLLLAIWRRISDYGITEERYFVIILGLWLAGIVIWFIAGNTKNIRVIPSSLCVITFLISFGPWSAFSISEQSQLQRLQGFLQQNEILVGRAIQPAVAAVPFDDRKEISSIVHYLVNTHGTNSIQPWFEQDLNKLTINTEGSDSVRVVKHHEKPKKIMELMGIEYIKPWERGDIGNKQGFFVSNEEKSISIEGFDWLAHDVFILNERPETIVINDRKLTIKREPASLNFRIYYSNDSSSAITVNNEALVNNLFQEFPARNYDIPKEEMAVSASNSNLKVKIYYRRIEWREKNKNKILDNANFDVLISFNQD